MAIQMRKGLKADFDPTKMLPGEWAVSIDSDTSNQIVCESGVFPVFFEGLDLKPDF